jgi:hypothetical protein
LKCNISNSTKCCFDAGVSPGFILPNYAREVMIREPL